MKKSKNKNVPTWLGVSIIMATAFVAGYVIISMVKIDTDRYQINTLPTKQSVNKK